MRNMVPPNMWLLSMSVKVTVEVGVYWTLVGTL